MLLKKLSVSLALLFQTACATFPEEGRGASALYQGTGCNGTSNCRPLTENEIALAQTVFGDQVNYQSVRIINKSNSPLRLLTDSMSPDGNIYVYDPMTQSADNALASRAHRNNFMHEMTHVWQYQRGVNLAAAGLREIIRNPFNFNAAYRYTFGHDFYSYRHEQQAAIVQHYVQLKDGADKNPSEETCLALKKYHAMLSYYLPVAPKVCAA